MFLAPDVIAIPLQINLSLIGYLVISVQRVQFIMQEARIKPNQKVSTTRFPLTVIACHINKVIFLRSQGSNELNPCTFFYKIVKSKIIRASLVFQFWCRSKTIIILLTGNQSDDLIYKRVIYLEQNTKG